MRSDGKTDIGSKRATNQDYIFCTDKPIGMLPNLYIVCDGMGGHRAGDKAARMAVEITKEFVSGCTLEDPIEVLKRAMVYANNEIYKAACKDPDLKGMGTTMVACVAIEETLVVANVGDSRLYEINSEITQITMDHSLVEEMIRNGEIDRTRGRSHPEKNIITRAMGSKDEVVPDFFEINLNATSRYLLCSDGLSNMVEDDEIRDIVLENDYIESATTELIERANYYGGSDNISVILIES